MLKTRPLSTGFDRRLLTRLTAFSPIAARLLSVLSDERTSFKEVSRLIMLDPVLAAQVLRLANSGLYGRRSEVRSILTAIALLGLGKLSQIVTTASLWRGLARRTSPFVREWWRHSIASALLARSYGDDTGLDFAYTAALLHGVGQLAMFEEAPETYPDLVERAHDGSFNLLAKEKEEFGINHATLAGVFLESWGLPETLFEAVERHHDANASTPLALAVQTGCAGAEWAGFGRCGCGEDLAAAVPGSVAELFAGDYPLATLVAEVNQIECSLG